MNIIKPNVKWNPNPTDKFDIKKIDGIGLHHMAHPTWTFEEVHAFHRDTNKWRGIAYNWWVGFDGKVYEGRGWYYGAGIKGHNTHVVSIGFQGNYEPGLVDGKGNPIKYQDKMPDAQFDAGVELIKWLKPQLPNVRVIHGHKYWTSTSCPGKYFPLAEMVALNPRKKPEPPKPQPLTSFKDVPVGHFAEADIAELKKLGIIAGKSETEFGFGETVTREQLAAILGRFLKEVKKQ